MYLTIFLTVLVLLLLIIFLLLTIYPVRLAAEFNSQREIDVHLLLTWLNPFLKAKLVRDKNELQLTVHLFNTTIIKKNLTHKAASIKGKGRSYQDYVHYAQQLHLNHIKLYASYGFEDPSVTGMFCGIVDVISQAFVLEELYNNASFVPDYDFFNITASAEINAAASLLKLLRMKTSHSRIHAFGQNK